MKRLVWWLVAVAACGPAPHPAAPSNAAVIHAPTPCVPALTSTHVAITGSAGAYGAHVLAIAVSRDRRTIVTARADGVLQVDDVAGGTTRCLAGVHAFALSEDARWAAGLELTEPSDEWLEEAQRGLTLWDTQRGVEVAQVAVETPEPLAGAVSDQGVIAVTGNSDRDAHVLLWDHDKPRELAAVGWPARPAFAPDGRTLLAASSYGPTDLYRAPGWKDAVTTTTSPAGDSNILFPPTAVATGTSRFVIGGERAYRPVLELWAPGGDAARSSWPAPVDDLGLRAQGASDRVVATPGGEVIIQAVSFSAVALSPAEDTVAAGFDRVPRVLRYDARTGAALAPLPLGGWWPVALAYSSDGRWLVADDALGAATIFDARTSVTLATSATAMPVPSVVDAEDRSADGSRVLVGSNGKLALRDATGKELWSVTTRRESDHHRVLLSRSGRYAWSGGNYDSVLVDAASGKELWRAPADLGAYEAAFTPDEAGIVISTAGGIEVYAVGTGKWVRELTRSSDALHFALSPDGTRVIGGYGDSLKTWDVETGEVLRDTPMDDGVYTMSVAYAPDGRRVVTAETDTATQRWGAIAVWDGATGAPVDRLSIDPLESRPRRVAFTGNATFTVALDNGSRVSARLR